MDGFCDNNQQMKIIFTIERTQRLKSASVIAQAAGISAHFVEPSLSNHHEQYGLLFGSVGSPGVSSRRNLAPS